MTEVSCTFWSVKVDTQMKRSLFSISSFGAYFIAYLPVQAFSQVTKPAETNHCLLGIGLDSSSSISGLLETVYFLTPNIMDKKYFITHDCANMAVRALYCYKRIIGIGADLHGDMPDRSLQQQIDAATKEIWSQAMEKKDATKRPSK